MDKPSRFNATPGEILDWLRDHFAEDTLLRFYQHVSKQALGELIEELDDVSPENCPEELREAHKWGLYPSFFICSKHMKCPGFPRCRMEET